MSEDTSHKTQNNLRGRSWHRDSIGLKCFTINWLGFSSAQNSCLNLTVNPSVTCIDENLRRIPFPFVSSLKALSFVHQDRQKQSNVLLAVLSEESTDLNSEENKTQEARGSALYLLLKVKGHLLQHEVLSREARQLWKSLQSTYSKVLSPHRYIPIQHWV